MLGTKQQWCPRCKRHVQTEQKQSSYWQTEETRQNYCYLWQVPDNVVKQNDQRICT